MLSLKRESIVPIGKERGNDKKVELQVEVSQGAPGSAQDHVVPNKHDFDSKREFVFCDSQSLIHLTKNEMNCERTKLINVKFHFFPNVVLKGVIAIHH